MKRIFVAILTALLLLSIASCGNGKINDSENEIIKENSLGLEPISYDFFKKTIDFTMSPVDLDKEPGKNIVNAVTGYNGEVGLTYYSFVAAEDAKVYFDEIVSDSSLGTQTFHQEDGDYEIAKYDNSDKAYMVARLANTILLGYSRYGVDKIETWFDGFGYGTGT